MEAELRTENRPPALTPCSRATMTATCSDKHTCARIHDVIIPRMKAGIIAKYSVTVVSQHDSLAESPAAPNQRMEMRLQ